jgi:cephalosporin-C deacetylase-like acetyl esterase
MRIVLALGFSLLISSSVLSEAPPAAKPMEKGTITIPSSADQKSIPVVYRLQEQQFSYQMKYVRELPDNGVEVFEVTFPSPVKSPHAENNTVHAEYYRPKQKKPFPCVIVLDITGGDQTLSRLIARHLAQNGVGGLFVQMAYYGPRRPPGSNLRLLSYDLDHSKAAIRQTVLDLRCATAWMEARPEIDAKKLGIMGTSLGSFMAALTAEMEPKLGRLTVLLGGGGFIDGYWDHPQVVNFRKVYESLGGTKKMAQDVIADVDPITYAGLLKDRKVLIIAAKNDEIVPPKMAENLWNATGQQRIIWLNAGHYSAAIFLIPGLNNVVEHFKKD